MPTKFVVGKTYQSRYTIISRGEKTIQFTDSLTKGQFRRKIRTFRTNGNEYVDSVHRDYATPISSENVTECKQNL